MSWCWLWLRVVAVVGWRADEGEHLSFEGGFAGFLLLFGETGDVGPFGHSSGLLVRSEAGFVPEMGFQKAKESVDGLDGVTAGFLVGLELEESTILHFEEEVIERAEAVGTFVETGMAAFDGLLDHGTVDRIVACASFGEGFHGFGDEFEGVGDGWAGGSLGGSLAGHGLGSSGSGSRLRRAALS